MSNFKQAAEKIKGILGLESEPVAVFLVSASDERAASLEIFKPIEAHRYCQLLMRARRGESVRLVPDELACPAAAAAFGFRPLPESLASGRGLVGFGITRDAETGRMMFEAMPRLEPGQLASIAACPLKDSPELPDVVVVEGAPEKLMWLVLADLNEAGGRRRKADTAVLQATCVDATVIPFLEQRLNFSLGCYGCREATDLAPEEAVIGFPAAALNAVVNNLSFLREKAIPKSRVKGVFEGLRKRTN